MNTKKTLITQLTHYIWSFFLSGLFTILPIVLTLALFRFAFGVLKSWFHPLQETLAKTTVGNIPHIELIAVIIMIFVIGILMQLFLLRSFLTVIEEAIIFRIPIVRPIYTGIKQLVSAFSPNNKLSFKKTVLIQFPRIGVHSIGFVTGRLPTELSQESNEELYYVFVPHTPNPTSGFLVIASQREIVNIDLTRQEAMALIISGGIITPERFVK